MNWIDGPATWKQIRYLSHFGYKPDHALTKSEAIDLIRRFGGQPEAVETIPQTEAPPPMQSATAYDLRLTAQKTKQAVTEAGRLATERLHQEAAAALAKRQQYWIETCHDAGRTQLASAQAHTLYQKFGCTFVAPTLKQVQNILDALDSAMPFWDRDHPEVFYRTLELNFPELLRRR